MQEGVLLWHLYVTKRRIPSLAWSDLSMGRPLCLHCSSKCQKKKRWRRIKDSDGHWFCFSDEAGQAAVRTQSLSLKKHKKEPFWIASPWCLRGNWKSSPDVFSHNHNICLISGKRRIRFLASFPSPFPLQSSFLPSSTNPPSVLSLPSSRSLQAEQVKSADLLLLIWGFDWYYCKAWLERNRCVEIRRTHRNQRAIEWKQTHFNYLFCVCACVCSCLQMLSRAQYRIVLWLRGRITDLFVLVFIWAQILSMFSLVP